VFARSGMEEEWLAGRRSISLYKVRKILDQVVVSNPERRKKYYQGEEAHVRFARRYSYSDRCRYYWPQAKVQNALGALFENLSKWPLPLNLLSQYMPVQYNAVREGRIANTPTDLVHSKILEVIDLYAAACGMRELR